jgi:hypothetical protein
MAKIQSPSGETEFFQVTELQQAFEKELKSGEKVSVAPGVIEASFLREAPVRAEYEMAFNDFKDKMLNPQEPFQPPARKFFCALSLRIETLRIENTSTLSSPGTTYSQTPTLGFTTTFNPPAPPNRAPKCNSEFPGVLTSGVYNFQTLPFENFITKSAPREVELIIPDYWTLTAYLKDWSPAVQALGGISCGGISVLNTGDGGGTNFVSGTIVSQNIPAGTLVPNIFNIVADLYIPAYDDPNPDHGITGKCSYTLFNYRLTNLYP